MNTTDQSNYQELLKWCKKFSGDHEAKPIDGDYYDMPGQIVYTTARRPVPSGGRLEVNLTTPAASEVFSWRAELTIDDAENQIYQHILLTTDDEVIETYGKQIIPVGKDGTETILKTLNRLS